MLRRGDPREEAYLEVDASNRRVDFTPTCLETQMYVHGGGTSQFVECFFSLLQPGGNWDLQQDPMAAVGRRTFCATSKFSAANVLVAKRTPLPCASRHRHCFRQQFSSSSQERGKWDESETGSGRSHTETAEEALAQAKTLAPLSITALGVGMWKAAFDESLSELGLDAKRRRYGASPLVAYPYSYA